jgi:hypothetical protein
MLRNGLVSVAALITVKPDADNLQIRCHFARQPKISLTPEFSNLLKGMVIPA